MVNLILFLSLVINETHMLKWCLLRVLIIYDGKLYVRGKNRENHSFKTVSFEPWWMIIFLKYCRHSFNRKSLFPSDLIFISLSCSWAQLRSLSLQLFRPAIGPFPGRVCVEQGVLHFGVWQLCVWVLAYCFPDWIKITYLPSLIWVSCLYNFRETLGKWMRNK